MYLRQGFDSGKDAITMNLLTDLGFLNAIGLSLRLMVFGLLFGGVPCESYSFMSSGTHERSAAAPSGKAYPFVIEGSTMASRFAFLALLVISRGGCWMAENPFRSVLEIMPCMQLLLNSILRPLKVYW